MRLKVNKFTRDSMAHRISNKEASRNMHRPNRSRAPRHLNNSMLEMEQLDSVKTFFFLTA